MHGFGVFFNEYASIIWTGLVGLVTISFALGRLWVRVENAIRSTGRLHDKTNEMSARMIVNETEIRSVKERQDRNEQVLIFHQKEASERYAALVTRLDNVLFKSTKQGE